MTRTKDLFMAQRLRENLEEQRVIIYPNYTKKNESRKKVEDAKRKPFSPF
jgi:nicotinic acid mononucleotide adenylyltransferase